MAKNKKTSKKTKKKAENNFYFREIAEKAIFILGIIALIVLIYGLIKTFVL